jgi:hypothetical protein
VSREDEYDDYDNYDDGPYRSPDELPHRGGIVLAFGILSIVLAVASLAFCLPVVFGLPLGILAWVWGRKDLRAMDAGLMDPEGRGNTQGGFICGIIGTVLCSLLLLALLAYLAFIGVMIAAGGLK